MPTDRVTVLYVIGKGRSGSTLLDRVVGGFPGVFAAGELRLLWSWGLQQDAECACGAAVRSCPVWSEVLERVLGTATPSPERVARLAAAERDVQRWTALPRQVLGLDARIGPYTDRWGRLYRAIAEVTGADVVVDSSKWPAHPGILGRIGGIEPRVVHLVRDPRAVAFSYRRHRGGAGRQPDLPRFPPVHSALSWLARNAVAQVVTGRTGGVRLPYERFAEDPAAALRVIADLLGRDPDDLPLTDRRTVAPGVSHQVGGNPSRFREGPLTIQADDAWRRHLPARPAAVVTAVTAPLLRSYGYAWDPRRPAAPPIVAAGRRTPHPPRRRASPTASDHGTGSEPRTLRLAYVGPVPPHAGGIAQHGARLVGALRAAGHVVTVESWRSQYPRLLHPDAHRRVASASPRATRARLRWYDPVGWVRVGRSLRDHDVVVVPWVTPLQAPALATVAWASHLPVVAVVHNPLPHERQPLARPLARWFLGRVDGAVTHAAGSVEVLRHLGLRGRTAVVAHPPNVDLAPQPLPPRPPLRLLSFGFVRPYKGVDVLLDAVARLRRDGRDVRLTVAGRVWGDPGWVARRARALGIAAVVGIEDRYVADDELEGLFGRHHLVVAPYRSATQSGVVPLAASAARAVVATAVGGLTDQVVDGVTGVLVPPGDAGALAAGIAAAASRLDELGAAAHERTPTWRAVATCVADVAADVRRRVR